MISQANAPRMANTEPVASAGTSGTIGRAVAAELAPRHELITAGRSSGDLRLDLTDPASIRAVYAEAGSLDAVVCAAGNVTFKPFAEMTAADYDVGLRDKLMGQVNLVLFGRKYDRRGGPPQPLRLRPLNLDEAQAADDGRQDGTLYGVLRTDEPEC